MAWSVLQSKEADTGGSALSSITATFTTANVTAGSKIIVAVACASSPAITCTGVADAASNAWTLIKRQALPAFGEVSLWALDVPAGDAGTKPALTATLSGTGGAVMIAQEVSGLLAGNTAAMCDGTPVSASGTGGTSTGSPAYSTAAANEYLVSIYGDDGSGATWTVPAGYTGDATGVNASTIDDLQIASKNSTGGSEASSYTITSSGQGWGQIVVAFQLASGAGGTSANAGVATASAKAPQPGIAGQVTSQGVPVNAHSATGSVTGTWPAGSEQAAGRLLAAVVTAAGSTSAAAISTPAGWVKQAEEGNSATAHARCAVYTRVAAGGDAAPAFTSTESGTAGGMNCMLFELIGADTATITDTSGVFGSGSSTTTLSSTVFTCTTSAAPAAAGEYAIAVFSQERAAASLTFTDAGTGWTKLLNGSGVSTVGQAAILVQQNPPTGAALNDHGAFSTTTTAFGAAIVMVFLRASPGTTATAGVATSLAAAPATASTPHAAVATAAAKAGNANFSPFLTQILGTGTAQYFADQSGNPYLLRWDTAWNLIVNAGQNGGAATWQSDIDTYTATRASQGFNGFLTSPTVTTDAQAPADSGATWDGVAPFSSPGVLNSTYWQRIDYLLASAQAKGLTVVMNMMYTYSLNDSTGGIHGWTSAQYQAYGAAVGTRYATQANLVWEVGDDYGGSWVGGQIYDTAFSAFLTGLRGAGANQLISVENMSGGSSRYACRGPSDASYTWGIAHAQFDWIYDYNTSYNAIEDAYTEAAANSVSPLCVCRMDGWYDNEGTALTESVELFGRKSYWWSLSSGSRGYMYGAQGIWNFTTTALSLVSSPGSSYMQPSAIKAILDTFAAIPGWHQLVPDTSSALVTAGRGTRSSDLFAGVGAPSSGSQYEGGDTYVSASRTPDAGSGSALAVIYLPAATTITIDQAKMAAGYTATWVDPASGAATSATAGSSYNSTALGTNSAGDHDWLLVLQASSSATATAGVAAAAASATAARAAGTATAGAAVSLAAAPAAAAAGTGRAGIAAALAGAPSARTAVQVPAGAATSLAVAPAATASAIPVTSANAGVAAVSAAAPAGTVTGTATAGVASALAAALAVTSASTAMAGAAEVQAAARAAIAAQTAATGAAGVLAVAPPVTPAGSVTVTAGVAAVAAAAPVVLVSASGSTTAFAGAAGVLAVARAPQSAAQVPAGVAPVLAAAPPATAAAAISADTASGLALAPSATAAVTPAAAAAGSPGTAGTPSNAVTAHPGTAVSPAAVPGASVIASGSATARAGAATAAAAAAASAAVSPAPGPAAVAAAATQPMVSAETATVASAAVAAVTATAGALRAAATAQALAALSAATATDAATGTAYGNARAGQMTIPRATAGQQMTVPRAVAGQWN